MAGTIADIEACYASATQPVVKVYALRDCLLLDYAAYRVDATVGRRVNGAALPYFQDQVFAVRVDRYALRDGFTAPEQLTQYLEDGEALVETDLGLINAGPVIARAPTKRPVSKHQGLQ